MTLHKNIGLGENHALHNWNFVDAAERDGQTYVAADVGKEARLADGTFWRVISVVGGVATFRESAGSAAVQHFKGKYISLGALTIAHPTAIDGDYAIVDAGTGINAIEYIWDTNEGWVAAAAAGAGSTDSLIEGSTNLYFTAARAIASVLTGFTAGAGTVSSSDSILQALQKIVGNLANYELTSNKSTSMATDFGSNTKYLSAKAVYDWAIATFTAIPAISNNKAIFGYGDNGSSAVSLTNLVSNTGVVATDTTGVGTARMLLAASGYGTDKAIFGYGYGSGNSSLTNLVSNTGVVATDTTGVGTARLGLAAAGYGTDKAIFGYGNNGSSVSLTNLVSNTGVVATDTTGVGTARQYLAASSYGTDKAIFGYGYPALSLTNLVSNTGVVATDTTGVGTGRAFLAATKFSS